MAFANLFTGLAAVVEGVTSPGPPNLTHRTEAESGQRGKARKRKIPVEQTGLYKKLCHEGQRDRSNYATSFNEDASKAVHNADSERVIQNQSYKDGYNNNGQIYTAKKNRKWNKQQRRLLQKQQQQQPQQQQQQQRQQQPQQQQRQQQPQQQQQRQQQPQQQQKKQQQPQQQQKKQQQPQQQQQQQQKRQQQQQQRQRQQYKTIPEGQKYHHHHQPKDGRPANRGGGFHTQPTRGQGGRYRRTTNYKQDFQVQRTRLMTQEFKDQNALLVNGRLICRHFLLGRCIKACECQLEHVKAHNNLVKEVCKFYVQGFCLKGESCPYMHKSFPCKFFHQNGKCSKGEDCRFSHEPLNDASNKLLHDALKRDDELNALAKKAEQESSGQPENRDDSEITEPTRTSNEVVHPLRPNFYNSREIHGEKESLLCQSPELADVHQEAAPAHAADVAQPHMLPSSNLQHEEPVCYSVAAVLGPQLFKPFPSFFTSQRREESGSSVLPNQSEVPYSVDAVLRSKSVENSIFIQTPTLYAAKTVSYTPKADFAEIHVPVPSSETQDETFLHSIDTRKDANNPLGKVFKSPSSLNVDTSLLSKNFPSLPLASRHNKTHGGTVPQSMKPGQRAANEVKLELLHSTVTVADKSATVFKREGALPFGCTNNKSYFSKPLSQTSTSKHPTESRPVLTSDPQAPQKPFSHLGFPDFKSRAVVPVEPVTTSIKTSHFANPGSHHVVEKQPTDLHLHSKKPQAVLSREAQQPYLTAIRAEGSSEAAHCCDLAVECKDTQKRTIHSLFARPLFENLQPIEDSEPSSSRPQNLIQSSCPAPQPAGSSRNCVKAAGEPDKAPSRSFLRLFAAPLSDAPQPDLSGTPSSSQQLVDNNKSHLSNSESRASDIKTPLQHQIRSVEENSCLSPDAKTKSQDCSTEKTNEPLKLNPVSLIESLGEISTSPTKTHSPQQQLPDTASHKVADSAGSVLKSLFLTLNPYQQHEEQQMSVTSDSRLPVQRPTEKKIAQIPSEATGGSTLSSSGSADPQVKKCGTHSMPCIPVVPPRQRHARPQRKPASEGAPRVNGDVPVTPLKDLFKTLETTVFHFGQ
ncbi:uncharacterized protein LOC119218208 isoform X2 [Pungitius pungitius]|uniref:uncharacterized protein LOC119218208 isoform X2 n=1 Tax=Pungitius pungitius TaxID=134920 RepID=UPI002E0D30C7